MDAELLRLQKRNVGEGMGGRPEGKKLYGRTR